MFDLKTIAAIIILLNSSSIPASTSNPILAKFSDKNWEFGGNALYFKPNINSDNQVKYSIGDLESTSFIKDPQWGFGFMLDGSYKINHTNNIYLNWYHLSSNTNSNINASRTINIPSEFNQIINDIDEGNFSSSKIKNTKYNISPKWNMVNLEFGKNINFSKYNAIRFHGGLEFSNLYSHNSLSIIGSVTTKNNITNSFNSVITNNNSYSGFGPRLGADMYAISEKNFEIYAKGAIALLAGPNKYKATTINNALSIKTTINNSLTSIVPEIDGKLGIYYVYKISESKIIIDCGWMWINYFNAIVRQDNSYLNTKNIYYDFGLNGIYWGLKWLA